MLRKAAFCLLLAGSAEASTVTMDFTLHDGDIAHLKIVGDSEGAETVLGIFGRLHFRPEDADVISVAREWPTTDGEPWINRSWCLEDFTYAEWAFVDVWAFTPPSGEWDVPFGIDAPITAELWFQVYSPEFAVSWDPNFANDWFFGTNIMGMTASPYVQAVPEPNTGLLVIAGLLGFTVHRRAVRAVRSPNVAGIIG